jgi:ABC-2 type transport system ATP-binding protein
LAWQDVLIVALGEINMTKQTVINVSNLSKSYGSLKAVDGISFQVYDGEIFGMVGPNGSGKTTTIECIEGLRQPDTGKVSVMGLEPIKDKYSLYERTGIQLQSANLPPRMRVEEALDLFASFYQQSVDWRDLLKELGLTDKRRTTFSQLSGGQKQRLFIALALINQPQIVFLDELTTGLDPQARHATWDLIRQIRQRGTTVYLTTHFMDEAEQLCDRVAILDHGKLIALDTPENLVNRLGMETRLTLQLIGQLTGASGGSVRPFAENTILAHIGAIEGVRKVEEEGGWITVYGQGDRLVSDVVNTLEKTNLPYRNLRTEQANLEDVFLALTGREIRN